MTQPPQTPQTPQQPQPASLPEALARTLPDLVVDLVRAERADQPRRWTRAEQALTQRILADRYLDDLQVYGPGITLAALADALATLSPYVADPRLSDQTAQAALGVRLFAQAAQYLEQRQARP